MAYPLAERYAQGQKKPEPTGKPLFTPEKEAVVEGVQELIQTEPVQAVLQTPFIQAVGGGLRTIMKSAGEFGEYLKEEAQQPIEGVEDIGPALAGTALIGLEKLDTGVRKLAEKADIDPDVASMGKDLVFDAVTGRYISKAATALSNVPPAPPMQPALAGGGGGLKLDFGKPRVDVPEAPQVMPLTITKPERLAPGIREGIAKEPEIAKQLTKRAGDVLKQENRLVTWREFGGPRSAKNIKKAQADVYSKKSTMPQLVQDDPIAYRVAEYKDAAKINLEQHHLFTKAQSSAFVDRMQELIEKNIADQDDLVAMGEYAKHLGAAMGDVNSNMFNMHTKPHNIFHTKMRKAGQEVKPDVLMQQLRKAKNADELMDMFHDYIVDNVLPNKKAAKEAQAAWEIANPDLYGAQKASAMDIFIKELRERGA